jgi:hypothetical protein
MSDVMLELHRSSVPEKRQLGKKGDGCSNNNYRAPFASTRLQVIH